MKLKDLGKVCSGRLFKACIGIVALTAMMIAFPMLVVVVMFAALGIAGYDVYLRFRDLAKENDGVADAEVVEETRK